MKRNKNREGFTLVELLVVITILALLIGLMLPAINAARAMAQQMQCGTKQKDLALACNLYEGKYKFYPACGRVPSGTGASSSDRDGYSFLVDLLPFIDQEAIWNELDLNQEMKSDDENPSDGKKANKPKTALSQSLASFRCPSTATSAFVDMTADREDMVAITNYKAVSASTQDSYNISAEGTKGKPYGTGKDATTADGVMYIGSKTKNASVSDGTTNTLLLTESEEQNFSRWIVGQECGLYTMIEDYTFEAPNASGGYAYYRPTGFETNKYATNATQRMDNMTQNLNRNYAVDPYPWNDLPTSKKAPGDTPTYNEESSYGPSSSHRGVTVHADAMGAVRVLNNDLDPAVYFFMTTRANGDPNPDLESLD
ncbi:MAG: DUF1559 domain-containing protein [Planctomycetia bacterium]|nr:DUF1559 domain-containing protein [Planctomycetia bacterium]